MVTLGTVMNRYAQLIVDAIKKNIKSDETLASGKLLASVQAPVKIFGTKFVIEINMEDYWKNVDEGQKPGTKPDVQKILKWMRHKGIQPKPSKTSFSKPRSSKAKKVFKDRRLALAERISNAIYRKGTIKRFGYKGTDFLSDSINTTLINNMKADIRKATGKDIAIQLKSVLK